MLLTTLTFALSPGKETIKPAHHPLLICFILQHLPLPTLFHQSIIQLRVHSIIIPALLHTPFPSCLVEPSRQARLRTALARPRFHMVPLEPLSTKEGAFVLLNPPPPLLSAGWCCNDGILLQILAAKGIPTRLFCAMRVGQITLERAQGPRSRCFI
jgi:hypothetical protein